MKRNLILSTFLLLLFAAPAAQSATLSMMLENDSFIDHIDRHYTNGLYLAWTGDAQQRDDETARLMQAIMLPGKKNALWHTGFFAGQSMFTPEDLDAHFPSPKDRPYAGWLYAGARLYRDSGDTLDTAEAALGVVGPASLAGDLQKSWHGLALFGGIYPNGWRYQLRDEPGLMLSEQRTWRVNLMDGPLEAEILPEANIRLGNIFTYAGAGAMLRIGSGLNADWGPARIAPAESGAARNIFLNGNTFQDSARVSSRPFVGDFNAGATVMFPGARLTASYTNRTREFVGQTSNDPVVSLSINIAN
jgi:hypothetical protein